MEWPIVPDQSCVTDFKVYLSAVASGTPLPQDQAYAAFSLILTGAATPAQLAAFIMGLRMRGETVNEDFGRCFGDARENASCIGCQGN